MEQPIVTALASFGMSGRVFHAPLLDVHPNFQLKTVLERKSKRANKIYPHLQTVRSFEELLADDEIELVIVNTPDYLHYEMVRQVLEAGKHAVVEKPFVLHSSDGDKLIELANKKKRMVSVFQNRRWDGDFLTVKKILQNDWLGRLVEYEAHFDRFRNFIRPNSWKETASLGSGTLYNLGSHLIDQVLMLLGMPNAVTANIQKLRTNSEVDDAFDITFYYRANQRIVVKATYLAREPGTRYTLHGTEGSFLKHGIDPQEAALNRGEKPNQPNWGKEPESEWGLLNTNLNGLHVKGKIETIAGNYAAFYDNIYAAIREAQALEVNASQANNVIKIIEAAQKSNETGSRIQVKS